MVDEPLVFACPYRYGHVFGDVVKILPFMFEFQSLAAADLFAASDDHQGRDMDWKVLIGNNAEDTHSEEQNEYPQNSAFNDFPDLFQVFRKELTAGRKSAYHVRVIGVYPRWRL